MVYYLLLKPNPVSTKINVFFNLKYVYEILYTEESKLQNYLYIRIPLFLKIGKKLCYMRQKKYHKVDIQMLISRR